MISTLLRLLRTAPEPRRLALFVALAFLAVGLGFFGVSPAAAKTLIKEWGYYYMLGLFATGIYYAWQVAVPRRPVWRGWLRRPGWVGAALVLATAFALWSDPFKHKVLFDEYVLQGTALHMHATKEIGTVIRAYDIAGSWTPIDTFLDKRPYFFTFLVALVHDLTGYRIANIFIVNAALTSLCLGLVYWLAQALTGRRAPALLAVGLLATMPLFGQNATGAGMEMHNLVMIAGVMALAILWLRAPEPDRLSLLVISTVLLAQSRYESVLFVLPVALIILAGWLRADRVILTWPAVVAPLLLVPYVWLKRIVDDSPMLWQLGTGQTSRFSLDYLAGNLAGAGKFFFNFDPALANSWYLSALGFAALFWGLGRAWSWSRSIQRGRVAPEYLALTAIGAGIAVNLGLLMFYYWSRLDDVIAARFALPMCFFLVLLAAVLFRWLDDRWSATRYAAFGLLVWMLGWDLPAMARRLYTSQNLVMQEVEWEHDLLVGRPGRLLFITNKSTLPYVLWHVPTIINGVGRQRAAQIKYHLHEGTFTEVIVAQAMRPTTAQGDMGVDPDDLMPDSYHLEPIAEKRFGARWARLSRLVSIDEPAKAANLPAGGAPTGAVNAP